VIGYSTCVAEQTVLLHLTVVVLRYYVAIGSCNTLCHRPIPKSQHSSLEVQNFVKFLNEAISEVYELM